MTYYVSYRTQSIWKIDRLLFVKSICGYTLIILCKIYCGLIFITPKSNALCKNIATKPSHQKTGGNQKLNIRHKILYNHWYKKKMILSGIKIIFLNNLPEAVNTISNAVLWFTYHIYFLNDVQSFIHKVNMWVYTEYCI